MFVVIFRATVGGRDADHADTAAHLRDLELQHRSCLDFVACVEGVREITVPYRPDQEGILAWRAAPAHGAVRRRGSYHPKSGPQVEVEEICRRYRRERRHAS